MVDSDPGRRVVAARRDQPSLAKRSGNSGANAGSRQGHAVCQVRRLRGAARGFGSQSMQYGAGRTQVRHYRHVVSGTECVRYGYGAGTGISSVDQVRDEAVWAAQAGFKSFWLSQVFGVDPIVALAAVGATVPELAELGTSVVPLAGRHPLALAAQARTAQSALKGRFTLGIGTSAPDGGRRLLWRVLRSTVLPRL